MNSFFQTAGLLWVNLLNGMGPRCRRFVNLYCLVDCCSNWQSQKAACGCSLIGRLGILANWYFYRKSLPIFQSCYCNLYTGIRRLAWKNL